MRLVSRGSILEPQALEASALYWICGTDPHVGEFFLFSNLWSWALGQEASFCEQVVLDTFQGLQLLQRILAHLFSQCCSFVTWAGVEATTIDSVLVLLALMTVVVLIKRLLDSCGILGSRREKTRRGNSRRWSLEAARGSPIDLADLHERDFSWEFSSTGGSHCSERRLRRLTDDGGRWRTRICGAESQIYEGDERGWSASRQSRRSVEWMIGDRVALRNTDRRRCSSRNSRARDEPYVIVSKQRQSIWMIEEEGSGRRMRAHSSQLQLYHRS